jgi:hypothetical protein
MVKAKTRFSLSPRRQAYLSGSLNSVLSKFDDLAKSRQNDGFVKSSPATGGTRRAKTEEGGALTGAPQRFTPLDLLRTLFSFESKAFIALPGTPDSYLTGQGFRATPQMDFLRDHQDHTPTE